MKASTKIYLRLEIYDYDYSERQRIIKHYCKTVGLAKALKSRLEKLITTNRNTNRSGVWLDRNYEIYGFISKVEGIFEETTVEVSA